MHPAVALWIIGIVLVVASWYIPSGAGFLVLGVLALVFGTILGLRSR